MDHMDAWRELYKKEHIFESDLDRTARMERAFKAHHTLNDAVYGDGNWLPKDRFKRACSEGDMKVVSTFYGWVENEREVLDEGLAISAKNGHIDIVRYLLDHGANMRETLKLSESTGDARPLSSLLDAGVQRDFILEEAKTNGITLCCF
jgi:hypothetical protein